MSIVVESAGKKIMVEYIEVRPVAGVIFRLAADEVLSDRELAALDVDVSATLRSSAHRIYRACCDSFPKDGDVHADVCASAPKKGKAK